MAHHPRYRRRVLTGRPGAHPVYARVAELYKQRHYERVDAMFVMGRWLVSQEIYDALKELPKRPPDELLVGSVPEPIFVKSPDPLRVMASAFNSHPIEVSPVLPVWRKKRWWAAVLPEEPRATMRLAEGTAKLVEFMSKLRPPEPPARKPYRRHDGDFYDPNVFRPSFR